MRKWLLAGITILVSFLGSAQQEPGLSGYKTTESKLQAWYQYCNLLADSARYKTLITASQKGIQLCAGNEPAYLGRFNYLTGYGYEYADNSYDNAVKYYELAEYYARISRDMHDETNALMRLNYMYYSTGKFSRRDSLIQAIKRITDTTKNNYAQAVLNGSIGEYYLDRSEYESFIQYKLKAIDYRKKLTIDAPASNNENIGISYLQVAGGYLKMQQPEKAIEYLRYGSDYLTSYREGKAYLCNQYIEAFTMMKKEDSAKLYYHQLYNLMTAGDTLYVNLSYASRIMAEYYLSQQQMSTALVFGRQATRYAFQSKDEETQIEANITFGSVLYKKANYKEAIALLEEATPKAYDYDKDVYRKAEQNLSLCYAAINNWQLACHHLQNYSRISDSLNAETTKKNIAEYEAKYQNKEKQQQIESKNKELALARTRTLWMITGLILLLAIAALLTIIYRNKKRTAEALDQQNKMLAVLNHNLEEANATKARLFGIISHDLRSPISQVYQFLKLQQLNPKMLSEEQRAQLSQKIQEATGSLLETMEDLLLWSKTQMEGFETRMQETEVLPLLSQCLQLLQLNTEAKNISIKIEVSPSATVYTDTYFLQTIVRNLLQNAIKASPENGVLNIRFYEDTACPVLTVQNSGNLFTQDQYQQLLKASDAGKSLSGLGLRMVDELSRKGGIEVLFSSDLNDGTCAILTFHGAVSVK